LEGADAALPGWRGSQVGERKRCFNLFGGSRCRPPKVEGIPGRGEEERCVCANRKTQVGKRRETGVFVQIGGADTILTWWRRDI